MANNNTTSWAVFIPEVWSPEILTFLNDYLVMANLVSRFDAEAKKKGDVVHVTIAGWFVANDKVNDTDATLQVASNDSIDIKLDKYKEVTFVVEDLLAIQWNPTLMQTYTENAWKALAKAIDIDLCKLYASASTAVWAYNTAINEDTILEGKTALDEKFAPEGTRSLVVRSKAYNQLLKVPAFVKNSDIWPNVALKTGQLWMIEWFDVYKSENIVKDWVGLTDTHNIMFSKEWLALAVQSAPRVVAEYSVLKRWWIVWADVVYGVATVNPDYVVEVKS